MSTGIKEKTVKGIFWSGVEKIIYELMQFLLGVIMARLLLPSDYGVIGILMVFITFSSLFIDGGFTTALIQKNNRSELDFSTAFCYNLTMSVLIYAILFLIAPYVSDFYENDRLTSYMRVLSLIIMIAPFSSIHNTILTIDVDFKKLTYVTAGSCLISGIIGVVFAVKGYGVWALIIQQISMVVVRTLMLFFFVKWKINFSFSRKSFKYLFGFGVNFMLSNLLGRTYDNLYPLIIGKRFPMETLGFYTRGSQFASIPVNALQGMFMKVSFPVMASENKRSEIVEMIFRKFIILSSLVVFPVMFLLILIAKPLVIVVLTDKWINCVPFIQLLSIGFMFNIINAINLNLLYVFGHSDWALKLEVAKKATAIAILFISLYWGIWGICIGQVLYNIIAVIFNSYYSKRLISLKLTDQIKDFGSIWGVGFVTMIIVYAILQIQNLNNYVYIITCFFLYTSIFLLINVIFKTESYFMIKEYIVKSLIKK